MIFLNLSEGFKPFQNSNSREIKFERFVFPGGEPHIKLNTDNLPTYINSDGNDSVIMITSRVADSDSFMLLLLAYEIISQLGIFKTIELSIPYFPGARQDRRTSRGEPFSIKIYAQMINELKADNVIIFDPHSDVTSAILDNCEVRNNHEFVAKVIHNIMDTNSDFNLISPDAGTNKKILALSRYLRNENTFNCKIIKCDKTRNITTGKISDFQVYTDDLEKKPCIIVDDIADGGGTFIGLAKELKKKNAGKLYLVVSHGIFSKGFKELNKHFDGIYTTDSWKNDYGNKNVNVIKL